jgi:nitrogen fixation NifU-like protein
MYSPVVLDHFQSPRNVGELPEVDGIGEAGNPVNGNTITLYLRIRDNVIAAAGFRAFGCAATIASGSRLTEWVAGRTLEEALIIENDTIADALGGLPPTKMHCSAMAAESVRAAIADYRGRQAKRT